MIADNYKHIRTVIRPLDGRTPQIGLCRPDTLRLRVRSDGIAPTGTRSTRA